MDNKKEKKELFTTGKELKNTCALISHTPIINLQSK
jgi:hypothetical protein